MARIPLSRTVIGRVAGALACLVAVTGVFYEAGCARRAQSQTVSWHPASSPNADQSNGSTDPQSGQPEPRTPPVVTLDVDGKISWAYLDRVTGTVYSSNNAGDRSATESMIKAWLAADSLTRADAAGRQPNLGLIVPMIVDSNDNAAETIYLNNGADESIRRMIRTCQLGNTSVVSGWWSLTKMSARDAVLLGRCIADGKAAGPHWTNWLLDEMRQVRGEGRFGIIDGVDPKTASTLAIKNGWTLHYGDGIWQVNCLAIDKDWVLAVMMTYGSSRGLAYGAMRCASVAKQVVGPLTG
jgi:hypothetical protein